MNITERMHLNIRKGESAVGDSPEDSIFRLPPEIIPDIPDIPDASVAIMSVLEDIEGSFEKGVYAVVNIPVSILRLNPNVQMKVGQYLANRLLNGYQTIPLPGFVDTTSELCVMESRFYVEGDEILYPILAILPVSQVSDEGRAVFN